MKLEFSKAGSNDYRLLAEQWVPRPLDEVFAFFSDAANLEKLTPNWVKFEIVTPGPIEMRVGLLLDYRIRMRGLPMRWQSEITAWEPGVMFTDEQRRGPYKHWHHEHHFAAAEGGTLIRDEVRYGVPLGGLVHGLLVQPDLRKIFTYRLERTAELFGTPDQAGSLAPSSR